MLRHPSSKTLRSTLRPCASAYGLLRLLQKLSRQPSGRSGRELGPLPLALAGALQTGRLGAPRGALLASGGQTLSVREQDFPFQLLR